MKHQLNTVFSSVSLYKSVQWKNWLRITLCILFIGMFSSITNAQFIRIDIDIPAKTGVSDMEASSQNWTLDLNQSQQVLEGTYALTISSAENLQVLATLKHSEYLINEAGDAVKFSAVLAYRNDGKNKPTRANASNDAAFPMSNSGLLINYMKDLPEVLYAYLMVYTTIDRPKNSGTTYMGDLKLIIEYN